MHTEVDVYNWRKMMTFYQVVEDDDIKGENHGDYFISKHSELRRLTQRTIYTLFAFTHPHTTYSLTRTQPFDRSLVIVPVIGAVTQHARLYLMSALFCV